jgi:hypothetical protein
MPRPTVPAVRVGTWAVAARPARVYLHEDGDGGGLSPAQARALAAALEAAATQAEREAGRAQGRVAS